MRASIGPFNAPSIARPRPKSAARWPTLYAKSLAQFQHSPAGARELIHEGEAPAPANIKETELAAMTTVTRAILNLHETITRN